MLQIIFLEIQQKCSRTFDRRYTSRVLDVGNLINIFDENQYALLDKFRKIRNSLAHEGKHVIDSDAHHCFNLAEQIIYDEIKKIEIKDIDKITWH